MLELAWFKWGHQQAEAELSLAFSKLCVVTKSSSSRLIN